MKNRELSVRAQNIIEHLGNSWELPQELSPESLKHITELVVSLQEPYRSIGLKVIANHIVNDMSLHIINLMSILIRNSSEDDISLEERDETLDATIPEAFQILNELTTHISVQSLDDVATLSNITISLQESTDSKSASEAQSLLYEIPAIYYSQLTHEHLITDVPFHWTMQVESSNKISAFSQPIAIDINKISYSSVA